MVAIAITRMDLTAAALRAAAARSRDAQAARRMLAIALVLEGIDRKSAAETCGMDRQTLRDWVHRYNAEGLAGLANRRGGSRPHRLDPGQVAELVSWLEAVPTRRRTGWCEGRQQWTLIPARAEPSSRRGFPKQSWHDSPWKTGGGFPWLQQSSFGVIPLARSCVGWRDPAGTRSRFGVCCRWRRSATAGAGRRRRGSAGSGCR